jgi:hypothetical protein
MSKRSVDSIPYAKAQKLQLEVGYHVFTHKVGRLSDTPFE